MKIPNSVKIGCKDYEIKSTDKQLYLDGNPVYGSININSCVIDITLNNSLSKDTNNITFLHEVLHGIEDFVDIDLTEEQIEKLGKGLYLFIKDNPEVFER